MEIIDADGHVNDGAGQEEIAKYMPAGNRSSQVFPTLDHLHFRYLRPEANRSGLETPVPTNGFASLTRRVSLAAFSTRPLVSPWAGLFLSIGPSRLVAPQQLAP